MKLRTGLKALIGISVLGIGVAILRVLAVRLRWAFIFPLG
jgi:hypothetical protein